MATFSIQPKIVNMTSLVLTLNMLDWVGLLEIDWDSNLVWKLEVPYEHHDFEFVPENDNVIVATFHPEGVFRMKSCLDARRHPGSEFQGKSGAISSLNSTAMAKLSGNGKPGNTWTRNWKCCIPPLKAV